MHIILFMLALAWPLSSHASMPGPVQMGIDDRYPLAPYFTYVEDPAGLFTADALLKPSAGGQFRPAPGPGVNFGYSSSVFWLKAALRGDRRAAERMYLEIAYPTLDRVTVYLAAPDGSRQALEAGDLLPFSRRPYHHRNLVFPLTVGKDQEATLLIRVESAGSLTVPATLWREDAFHNQSRDGYAVHSLYFGVLGALILYNFMLFLSVRERVFLAYVCFVAGMALGQLSQSGFGNELLWPRFTAWGNIAFPMGFAATGFFGALFTRLFLDTPRHAPRLDNAIVVLAAGFAFTALSPAFLPYRATAVLTSLLGVSFSAVAVATGVVCLLAGRPGARYFLLAWALLLIGVAMLGMRNLAWLPTTFVTSYGMQIGSALEMLLLSFALADRINQMRREKDAAQRHALRTSNEKERELAEKAREWEETFNAISDMVVIISRDYHIVKANRSAAAFLGSGPQELVGLDCHALHHHQDRRRHDECPCRVTFGDGKPSTMEFYEPRFERFLEVSTSPILDSEGAVAEAVHITKDITWRKKMEEEIIKTQKLDSIAMLAGGIAHDFNNMLTIIMSTTTLAKMYAAGDARVVAKIEEAEREIIRTRELTSQLLTFAKGGAPVKRLSSFPDLLRDTIEFSLKGSNVGYELTIAPDLWAAEIDRTQISQVIGNLVLNAVQAMPGGGTIRVAASNAAVDGRSVLPVSPGRYVRIVIEDSGSGIDARHMSKIFDPFFTTKTGGSGLGLSTSYSIIKKHNGYIGVKSQAGVGSVFTIYLPATLDVPREEPEPAGGEMNGTGRLLLMDDDEKLLANVGEMLEAVGYEVETARNGEEAIILYKRALAQSRPFQAAVLDVTVVGGMGGEECIGHLRALDPEIRAIVVSGYSEEAVLAEYRRLGFREALAKPFTTEELQARLRKVMGGG